MRDLLRGMGVLLLCHVCVVGGLILLAAAFSSIALSSGSNSPIFWVPVLLPSLLVWLFSLTQLIYGIPLYRRFRVASNHQAAKGVLIGMGITAFLNATCFVSIVVLPMLSL